MFEPGKVVVLNVASTSTVGLWGGLVGLSGACDTVVPYPDTLLRSDLRAVRIVLPAACSLGVPLVASLAVLDARLQFSGQSIVLPALVDTTPPSFVVDQGSVYGGSDVFAGDSIGAHVVARDNHQLRSVTWSFAPGGWSGAQPVAGAAWTGWVQVPVPDTLAGPVQVTLRAVDASGNASPAMQSPPGALDIVPSFTPPVATASYPPWGFGDWVWDVRRNAAYYIDGAAELYAIDGTTGRTLDSLDLGDGLAMWPALTASGDSLVILLFNQQVVAVVNLRVGLQNALTRMSVPGLDSSKRLVGVAPAANGKFVLAATDPATGLGSIYTWDLASGTLRLRADAAPPGPMALAPMGVAPGDSVVVVSAEGTLLRYDAASDAFTATGSTTNTDATPVVARGGALVAVGGALYDGSLRWLRTPRASASINAPSAALSPDGRTMYVPNAASGVLVVRTSDGATVARLRVPLKPAGAWVSPDGRALGVADNVSHIALMNLAGLPAGAPRAGAAPRAIAAAPRVHAAPAPAATALPAPASAPGASTHPPRAAPVVKRASVAPLRRT